MEIRCKFGEVVTSNENITKNHLQAISIIVADSISEIRKLLGIHWEIPKITVIIVDDPLIIPFVKIDTHDIYYPYSSYLRLKTTGKKCCPDLVHEIAHLVYFNSSRQLLSEGLAVSCALIICGEIYYPYNIVGSLDLKEDSIKLAKRISRVFWEVNENPQTLFFKKNDNTPEFYALGGSFLLFLFSKFPANYILPLLQSNETDLSNLFSVFLSNTRNYLSTAKKDTIPLESINLLLEPWLLSSSNDKNDETELSINTINEKVVVTGDILANKSLNGFAVGVNIVKFGLEQARCREIQLSLATTIEKMQLFYTTANDEEPGKDYFYTFHPTRFTKQSQTISFQNFFHIKSSSQDADVNKVELKTIGLRAFVSFSQKIFLDITQFDLYYLV